MATTNKLNFMTADLLKIDTRHSGGFDTLIATRCHTCLAVTLKNTHEKYQI